MVIRKPTHDRSLRRRGMFEALESRLMLSYTYSVVATFHGHLTGNQPDGLVMDANGNLFGTTATGGAKGYGTVFEIAASSNTVTTLVSFTGANGITPRGNLVLDENGNLFGTTVGGGSANCGTIFEVAAGTASTITTLASFNKTNGGFPFAGLVMDAGGNLFGTTLGGGGAKSTVFELATGSSAITVLATFKTTDRLQGTLAIDSSGNIFGTTGSGGTAGKGSIFEIAGSAHTFSTLASFKGTNGSNPTGTLLLNSSGNLMGSTASGGASGVGTLFSLNVNATTPAITTLATFNGTKGGRPIGNLIVDDDGNIFGVTANGGKNGTGTVFERPAGTVSTLTTLYSFRGQSTGTNPTGALVMDPQTHLWGVTFAGGPSNSGVAFKLHNDDVVFTPPPPPQAAFAAAASPTPRLVITQAPASVGSGKQFALVIKLEDGQGRVVSSSAVLTLKLVAGPGGGKLGGTLSLKFVNGVASLSKVTLTGRGTYTLGAESGLLDVLTDGIVVT